MMYMVMMNIPKEERVFVGADCSGYVGESNSGMKKSWEGLGLEKGTMRER